MPESSRKSRQVKRKSSDSFHIHEQVAHRIHGKGPVKETVEQTSTWLYLHPGFLSAINKLSRKLVKATRTPACICVC